VSDIFDERDMSEALDLHRIISGTGMFDLSDPEDVRILGEASAAGAVMHINLGGEPEPRDIDWLVEQGAPLVIKLTSGKLEGNSKERKDGR
jgi:hypothetical protein